MYYYNTFTFIKRQRVKDKIIDNRWRFNRGLRL
jgi:hypothetical protein